MHYYKFNMGDYASHTRHLTPLEDIAYRRMLDLAYTTEQPLTKDIRQLSRLINLRDYQQEIIDVLNEFWTEVEEGWIHGRVLKELEEAGERSTKSKEAADLRWARVKAKKALLGKCGSNANASDEQSNFERSHENLPGIHATQDPRPKTQDLLPKTQDKPPEILTTTQTDQVCMSSQPAPTKKKATRLPADWVLPKAWGEWALNEKPDLTTDDVRLMAEMFRDHWIANASRPTGKKDDWFATWRNWVRKSHPPNRAGVPRVSSEFKSAAQRRADEFDRAAAGFLAEGLNELKVIEVQT